MGTGSFGGGGSGALGRSGSGAGLALRPRSLGTADAAGDFFAGRNAPQGPTMASARALVRDTFAQRRVGDYMAKMVSSPAVRGCFEEMFLLSVLLTRQRSWAAIERDYGVRDAPGCLADLATVIKRKHIGGEAIEAFREIAAAAVDDVLLAAVGNDDDVYLDGRADEVFSAVKKFGEKVFASLSGRYLGSVLRRAVIRELPALDEREKGTIGEATQERVNFIITKFEYTFVGKGQTTHRQLLKILSEKDDWFRGKLQEGIEQ